MPNLTSNFSFNKPLVNNATDADLWGGQLNTNWDDIDTDLALTTTSKTADFNVTASEYNYTYLIDASSGTVTATLPAAADVFNGFTVRFKTTDVTNAVTVDGNGSETIDGSATITLDETNETIQITCDGSNWQITSQNIENATKTYVDNNISEPIINTWTASNDAEIVVTGYDSTYKKYILDFINVVPASDGQDFIAQTSADGGSSYASTAGDYKYAMEANNSAGSISADNGNNAGRLIIGSNIGSATGESISGRITMYNPSETSLYKHFEIFSCGINAAGNPNYIKGNGTRMAIAAHDAFRLYFDSGNIESGIFVLRGVRGG